MSRNESCNVCRYANKAANEEPCSLCKLNPLRIYDNFEPMRIFDSIKEMSIEEMADFLSSKRFPHDKAEVLKWLECENELKDEELVIYPNDNTYVRIVDNATVTEETEFENE